jgi:hypothetical protein
MTRRYEVLEVRDGRPWRVRCQDCTTGEMGEEEWAEGLGPPTLPEENFHLRGVDRFNRPLTEGLSGKGRGAESNYDPIVRMEKESGK